MNAQDTGTYFSLKQVELTLLSKVKGGYGSNQNQGCLNLNQMIRTLCKVYREGCVSKRSFGSDQVTCTGSNF